MTHLSKEASTYEHKANIVASLLAAGAGAGMAASSDGDVGMSAAASGAGTLGVNYLVDFMQDMRDRRERKRKEEEELSKTAALSTRSIAFLSGYLSKEAGKDAQDAAKTALIYGLLGAGAGGIHQKYVGEPDEQTTKDYAKKMIMDGLLSAATAGAASYAGSKINNVVTGVKNTGNKLLNF